MWSIVIRPPLTDLLQRQRALSYVGREESWIFPTNEGNAVLYSNWYKRGWLRVLKRANVQAREKDAQKALRRSYITSSLVCGRNPKLVAADLGHPTARMVTDNYDSFLDPALCPMNANALA